VERIEAREKAPAACPEGNDEFHLEWSVPSGRSLFTEAFSSPQTIWPEANETTDSFAASLAFSSPKVESPRSIERQTSLEPIVLIDSMTKSIIGERQSW